MAAHTWISSLALIVSVGATGCAFGPELSGAPRASVRTGDYALLGAPASNTEREARLDAADDDGELNEKALTGSFWGGVIVGSVGAAGAVGFGVAGAVTTNQLEDGYREGMSQQERDDLVDRGETFNALAITGATLAVTGLAVAAIAHGIDATRCGPRARKRDRCRAN